MEMHSVQSGDSKEIKKTCKGCQDTFMDYINRLGLPYLAVDSIPLNKILLKTFPKTIGQNLEETMELISLSEKLGYLAFSDTILNSKDRPIFADKAHQKKWSNYYDSAVTSYSLADYLHSNIKPKGVVYFDNYVIHQSPVISAKEHGIEAYGCKHSYPDTHNIRFDKHRYMTLKENHHNWWLDYKEFIQTPEVVFQVFKNLNERLIGGGSNWYYKKPDSQSKKLLEDLLSQTRYKKIICVFPSSLDEIKAAMSRNLAFDYPITDSFNIFKNQLNWLSETINYFRERQDVVVIFRIHPRMGKNKRLNRISPHISEINTLFEDLPEHLIKIEPEHSISSYSLSNIADLIISSGTTLGLESTAIGVPVVRALWYYNFAFPVDEDIDGIGQSKEQHWKLVEEKLNLHNYNLLNQVKKTVRLLHYNQAALHLPSGYKNVLDNDINKAQNQEFVSYVKQILYDKTNGFQYITNKLSHKNCPVSEEKAIIFELKRRIHLIITGETDNALFDTSTNLSLHDIFNNSFGKLTLNDKDYEYSYKSKIFEGQLPFVERIHNFINSMYRHTGVKIA